MENQSVCNCRQDSGDEANGKDNKCKSDGKYKTVPPHRDSNSEFHDEMEILYLRCNDDQNDSEIDLASLIKKLASAVENENDDVVKSMLEEFRNTLDIFVKSLSSNQQTWGERTTKFEIWRDAMYIAMDKDTTHSEEILNILMDCDILLLHGYRLTGCPNLVSLLRHHEEKVDNKTLRLIEVLLKSGKINVNATDEDGKTALHRAKDEKLISLLIRYGADVNIKNSEGKTLLMPKQAAIPTFEIEALVLRTILKEPGTLLNLDVVDCKGRTVLMFGAMDNRPDVVELLLNAGASVNLSDHIGFTALHHALYVRQCMTNFGDTCLWYDHFPRNSEELKNRKEIFTILFDLEKPYERCEWYSKNKEQIERRIKIIEMLLQRPDIDVNALSFENFSPLDIAEAVNPQTPSSIKNVLKERGAILNVFRQTQSQSTNKFHLDVGCRLTLYRIVVETFSYSPRNQDRERSILKERLLTLIKTFQEQIVSGKDEKGRTALHLAAISFSIISVTNGNAGYLADSIVRNLISVGCNVNATDLDGRTPLHYADYRLQELLKSKGADASIKDKDGERAIDKILPSNDYLGSPDRASDIVKTLNNQTIDMRLLQINNKRMELIVQYASDAIYSWEEVVAKSYPRILWKGGKYAFRHPSISRINEEVRDLMNLIAKEIERLDPRFEIRPEFVGSSHEGTKLRKPDEFDFCFVLTKISKVCEVSLSPELPTGFVRLKRKSSKVSEESDFGIFFGKDEILNTEKLKWQFTTILYNAMDNIESQQSLDWNLVEKNSTTCKMISSDGSTTLYNKSMKFPNTKMINTLNFTDVNDISIDIVPCIHIDGWWPDEAISNVSDEIKKFGCNLVFDRPQSLYPWLSYSESCARISFSKAESDTIKQSCANAREAYMIGKKMIEGRWWNCGYPLKNCLLYCIEALTPTSEKASRLEMSFEELKSKFYQLDRYLWLRCLWKCHLEFIAQDFCPCYFLPNFCSPIPINRAYLKKSSLSWMTGDDVQFAAVCKENYAFYRWTSTDTTESCCQLPAPDPLWERFNRDRLIACLFEIAYK